jgi:kynurenine formamidase
MEVVVTKRFLGAAVAFVVLGAAIAWLATVPAAQAPQQQGGRAGATAPTPPRPHPATQEARRLVTDAQMKKWEKELSNWGRWGKDDQRGALNLITPAKTKAALQLVKEGTSVSLHRFPDLTKQIDSWSFGETIHRMANIDPATNLPRGAVDYVAFGTHDGTSGHMDALCHYALQSERDLGIGKQRLYNGFPNNLSLKGCQDLGTDKMGPGAITRGILIDMPLLRGVEWLEASVPLFVEDLEAWEKFANVKIGSGDAVFLRTGRYARRAKSGPWNAASTTAGLHASVIPWLKQRDIALLGGESVPDVQPSGVEGWSRPLHDILLPVMGTPLVDNAYLEDVAREAARLKRWEFMISWSLLRIPGGTATPFTALATF